MGKHGSLTFRSMDLQLIKAEEYTCREKAPQRSVRFQEEPEYREIQTLSDLSEDDINSAWYSEQEYLYIKTINNVTVRLLATGRPLNESIYCLQGLECKTESGLNDRLRNRKLVQNAVLQEQSMQTVEGVYDAEMFARVSCDASNSAREAARKRAAQVESER